MGAELIAVVPGKCGGQPHVKGTRITTAVLAAAARRGVVQLVKGLYPELSLQQIVAALEHEGVEWRWV